MLDLRSAGDALARTQAAVLASPDASAASAAAARASAQLHSGQARRRRRSSFSPAPEPAPLECSRTLCSAAPAGGGATQLRAREEWQPSAPREAVPTGAAGIEKSHAQKRNARGRTAGSQRRARCPGIAAAGRYAPAAGPPQPALASLAAVEAPPPPPHHPTHTPPPPAPLAAPPLPPARHAAPPPQKARPSSTSPRRRAQPRARRRWRCPTCHRLFCAVPPAAGRARAKAPSPARPCAPQCRWGCRPVDMAPLWGTRRGLGNAVHHCSTRRYNLDQPARPGQRAKPARQATCAGCHLAAERGEQAMGSRGKPGRIQRTIGGLARCSLFALTAARSPRTRRCTRGAAALTRSACSQSTFLICAFESA
jgi:hypothetical protein